MIWTLITSKNPCLENGVLSFQAEQSVNPWNQGNVWESPIPSAPGAVTLQVNGINLAACSLSCLFGLVFPRISWSQGCSLSALSKQAELDKNFQLLPEVLAVLPGKEEEKWELCLWPLCFLLTNPRVCIFKVLSSAISASPALSISLCVPRAVCICTWCGFVPFSSCSQVGEEFKPK